MPDGKISKDLVILENKEIRRQWDQKKKAWLFSVVDFIGAVTGAANPQIYWEQIKDRAKKEEGIKLSKLCQKIEIEDAAGPLSVEVATLKNLLRIIQSVPSPKAESFKRWLARAGEEKIENRTNPEKLMMQAMEFYMKKGYPPDWATLRLRSIATRKILTGEWRKRGITESEQFSTLTNDITRAWSGLDTKEYKIIKRTGRGSLRNHMTGLELILNMLAETSAVEISKTQMPQSFKEVRQATKKGGRVAGAARKNLEKHLSRSVIGRPGYSKFKKIRSQQNKTRVRQNGANRP